MYKNAVLVAPSNLAAQTARTITEEPTEENRRAWDRLQRARVESSTDQPGLQGPIRALLPDLAGKHVLHEQCGTGETSAELASPGNFALNKRRF